MATMNLKQITVVGGPLVKASPADVNKAEEQLWITFPKGYREYVTKLGEGVLGGSFVRVYPPWRIERERGQMINLAPGDTYTTRLRIEVHDQPSTITALQERIAALQIRSGPVLHRNPTLPYSTP